MTTPRQILTTLTPYLKTAALYTQKIQAKIQAHPEKEANSQFEAALSDADISVQTIVEVALLGLFPSIYFYGEEYEQSVNTKYFQGVEIGKLDNYLVTLDPVDGTRWYLDGHKNYQLVLGIMSNDCYEAAMLILPSLDSFFYAVKGEGAWQGSLKDDLSECVRLNISQDFGEKSTILLNLGMGYLRESLSQNYQVIVIETDYDSKVQTPNTNGILMGELDAVVLREGKLIDGAAIAFIAQEAGAIVSQLDGSPIPPLHTTKNYQLPGMIVAKTPAIQQKIMQAL